MYVNGRLPALEAGGRWVSTTHSDLVIHAILRLVVKTPAREADNIGSNPLGLPFDTHIEMVISPAHNYMRKTFTVCVIMSPLV
jgi:hypothetical protein